MTERELDAAVAGRVMGAALNGLGACILPGEEWAQDIPRYSTTGDGMLRVMDVLRKRGMEVVVRATKGGVEATVYPMASECPPDERWFTASGETLPKAVCLAALKAVGYAQE